MKIGKRTSKGLVAGGTPRVNLLPPQEMESRARTALRMRWLRAFIAAFILVALAWMVGLRWNIMAHDDLDGATQESARLQTQLSQYSEVINARAEVKKLQDLRAQAGSNDLRWAPLIAEIKSVLPDGVRLIGFKSVPGGAPVSGSDATAEVGLKGTLTFSAKATSAQSETITQLRTVKGFIDVDAGELSVDGAAGGFTFVTTFSADQTRYTGRFVQIGSK